MVNQLKLQNVTKYSANDGQDNGLRLYRLSAQDEKAITQLLLDNSKYARSSAPEYNKFDCELKYTDRYTNAVKESVKIEGLKIGGAVDYNHHTHVFTAQTDPAQSLRVEYSNPEGYNGGLNFTIHSDHLDLSM
ncbi:hypothetical protein [Wolbachia endosymbiont of Folsomia candida]|uniref:hypothetical protein n=1 Tax=Wolbachia endosymbiont of Folsomia candida TaxID=169402 RepID=UPI000AE7ABAE|nr:hypothetical protein [Wolbachia endosymbiont of Folsomia candida]APR97765.1 hypothetical protein ASM33_00180 [Wolbachia endosymbiont of Folsomia candida]